MPQSGEARAWWADVEQVRETIERRREAEQRAVAARAERHLSIVADREGRDAGRRSAERRAGDRRPAQLGAHDRRAGERRRGPASTSASADERGGGHRGAARRTVEITGRTVPAPAVPRSGGDPTVAFGSRGSSRRPSLSPADRLVHRPDRIAMWAVVLGFVLILVALTSA